MTDVEETQAKGSTPINKAETVLSSRTDFSVVHPLMHEWTLWYTQPGTNRDENWSDLIKELVTVSTVEEFWGAYNAVPKLNQLPLKADFSFFRKSIRPEWEDPKNQHGGKWIYQARYARPEELDAKWLSVLLGMIGGTLDNSEGHEQVAGVYVMIRKTGIKFALWVTTGPDNSEEVALRFKKQLKLSSEETIEYNRHDKHAKGKPVLL